MSADPAKDIKGGRMTLDAPSGVPRLAAWGLIPFFLAPFAPSPCDASPPCPGHHPRPQAGLSVPQHFFRPLTGPPRARWFGVACSVRAVAELLEVRNSYLGPTDGSMRKGITNLLANSHMVHHRQLTTFWVLVPQTCRI